MKKPIHLLGFVLAAPAMLLADFSYTETSRMTGGALMQMSRMLGGLSKSMRKVGEPTRSFVGVKGNKLVHSNDHDAQIWDLDAETITSIDFEARTYSTITFAQMKEAMEKAMQKAQSQMAEAKEKQEKAKDPNVDLNMKLDVKETGKVQNISGFNAKEVLMTIGMQATDKKTGEGGEMQTMTSIWVIEKVPGYEEINEFYLRMAKKMASNISPNTMRQGMTMAMDPRFKDSMEKMAKEMEKLKGFHAKQITKMGTNLDPAKASEITDPSTMPQGPTAGELASKGAENAATNSAERAAVGRLGRVGLPGGLGSVGGLGGFGRRKPKKEDAPPPPPAQEKQQAQAPASGVLMEMVVESGDFSNAPVDTGKFAVPAGLKQVEHPMLKMAREK